MIHRITLLLLLLALVVSTAQAGSVVAMKFAEGWYLFADTGLALHPHRLQHRYVSSVLVGQGLALVKADGDTFLYGISPSGIVGRKVTEGSATYVELGEDIAVVQAKGKTVLHGITANGFVDMVAGDRKPTSIQVSGRLVLMNFQGTYVMYTTSPTGIAHIQLAGRPSSIQLGRDVGVVRYAASGTWVVSLGSAGFHWVQASKGHPITLLVPSPLQITPGQETNFESIYKTPAPGTDGR